MRRNINIDNIKWQPMIAQEIENKQSKGRENSDGGP